MTGVQHSPEEERPAPVSGGRGWAIAGIVSGVSAILVVPIVLGPLGVILGVVGHRKGARRSGVAAVAVSVAGFAAGVAIALALQGGVGPTGG